MHHSKQSEALIYLIKYTLLTTKNPSIQDEGVIVMLDLAFNYLEINWPIGKILK